METPIETSPQEPTSAPMPIEAVPTPAPISNPVPVMNDMTPPTSAPAAMNFGTSPITSEAPIMNATSTVSTYGGGVNGPFPAELAGWNWGAFLLNWIWGVSNGVWISLLCLIPVVGFIMIFVLGAKGNEWAWQNRKFESIEQFKAVQSAWAKWGVGLFLLSLVLGILLSILGTVFSSK